MALVVFVALLAPSWAQAQAQWRLDADTWLRPRSGAAVVQMPPVARAVHAWQRQSGATLVIRHPGGEQGVLWAAQLRDWLVALGLPSSRIETVPGGQPEGLGLDVRRTSGDS